MFIHQTIVLTEFSILFLDSAFSNAQKRLVFYHLNLLQFDYISFFLGWQFDPNVQISSVNNLDFAVKLNVFNILANVHVSMPIDPVRMPFVIEA